MRIAVVSLFPQMIREALNNGVVGRALERGVFQVECFDPRDYTSDPHRTVDDRPYGGGPGMVMKVEPVRSALRDALRVLPAGSRRVYLGADGRRFEQSTAREACGWPGLVLVAGRYEGIDERFIEQEVDEQWSIGDYVLSGGELPALLQVTRRRVPPRTPPGMLLDREVPHVPGVRAVPQQDGFLLAGRLEPVSGHANIIADIKSLRGSTMARSLPRSAGHRLPLQPEGRSLHAATLMTERDRENVTGG